MKSLIKQLKYYLPSFLKKKIDQKVMKNKLEKHRERKKRVFVKLQEIENILDKFNFDTDIIIHSSTSNIGKIEGGAIQLTDLIISKIDLSKHTLLAPALPFLGSMKDYIESIDIFELKSAKNAMGNISNMIMKKDNCLRSLHPTHSVVALGRDANFYTIEHEQCKTPFCSKSPYAKITQKNGKILMFGVNLNSITNFHVYEDMLGEFLPINVYTQDIYRVKSIKDNIKSEVELKAHNPLVSAKRDCERARNYLMKNKYIETYKIGDSEISLLDAKGLTITLFEMLLKGNSIYGKIQLTDEQKIRVNKLLEELK